MADSFEYLGTLAVIGGGQMGEAIVGGLVSAGVVEPDRIRVVDPSVERRTALAAAHGVRVSETAEEALPADVVLVAVKPQVIDAVLTDIRGFLGEGVVVSIAAGITCARIESLLPADTVVVRVMPNTPVLVGEGMAIVSGGTEATAEQVDMVRALFAEVGKAVVVDERYQDAATAISGSGPAYFALVVDALARAGVAQGLTRDIAQSLAVQTMRGTAALLEETGQHPEVLVDSVTSPGGTTIAALGVLERDGVRSAFTEAVTAAVRRSKELGS